MWVHIFRLVKIGFLVWPDADFIQFTNRWCGAALFLAAPDHFILRGGRYLELKDPHTMSTFSSLLSLDHQDKSILAFAKCLWHKHICLFWISGFHQDIRLVMAGYPCIPIFLIFVCSRLYYIFVAIVQTAVWSWAACLTWRWVLWTHASLMTSPSIPVLG